MTLTAIRVRGLDRRDVGRPLEPRSSEIRAVEHLFAYIVVYGWGPAREDPTRRKAMELELRERFGELEHARAAELERRRRAR